MQLLWADLGPLTVGSSRELFFGTCPVDANTIAGSLTVGPFGTMVLVTFEWLGGRSDIALADGGHWRSSSRHVYRE